MSRLRRPVYREALQVSPERIARLNDAGLTDLMRELLRAEAYRCGAAVSDVRVNTEVKAADEGEDGWTPAPKTASPWLGSTYCCWQFKAGTAGQRAKLRSEVLKQRPMETLRNGGRFVVVASGSTSGRPGENARLAAVRDVAASAGLPAEAIDVIGSERLTVWCNQHPAVAARLAGRPDGLCLVDDWAASDEHQVPWQKTPSLEKYIEESRKALDFAEGGQWHIHVHGQPGVGKTRLALELCRHAPWKNAVIYVRQASDFRLNEVIDSAASESDVQLVIVADEVQEEQLRPLRDSIGRGNGKIRLLTIGHERTPDPTRIPEISISPIGNQEVSNIVKGWHPSMPLEHVDFVANFADGYVGLARLAADAVMREPSLNTQGLLSLDYIRQFLDNMLDDGNRRPLHVVAALTSVGWTDDAAQEGEAIAKHLGLDWNDVRVAVDAFHRQIGIAPRGGRYRYISPKPLGNYLATELWGALPERMSSLPSVLPTGKAREAYLERVRSIARSPQVRPFAREQLEFFFRRREPINASSIGVIAALSPADPALAAQGIYKELASQSIEVRLRIAEDARRAYVWALVQLAWHSESFADAVKSLALLAEAENESWGNNATGEFLGKFFVGLGGTAVPYSERLAVLDELLETGRPAIQKLVVKALAQVGNFEHETRMVTGNEADMLPEPEWHPANYGEAFTCIDLGIRRLVKIAQSGHAGLGQEHVAAAREVAIWLRNPSLRPTIAGYYKAVRDTYPEEREALRREIAAIIHRDRQYRKELPEEAMTWLTELHAEFEDDSLSARLRQHVGVASWDKEEEMELSEIATELLKDTKSLELDWSWLTSGDAKDAWRLGQAMGQADEDGDIAKLLATFPDRGMDLSFLCGYLNAQIERAGVEWYEKWLIAHLEQNPDDHALLLTAIRACAATPQLAERVASVIEGHDVDPNLVGGLAFGGWSKTLPTESLFNIVEQLVAKKQYRATAITLVSDHLKSKPTEKELWEPFALQLATDLSLIRGRHMDGYHWGQLALYLIQNHARKLAKAIFNAHADRTVGHWFVKFSEARKVLEKCIDADSKGVWQELTRFLVDPKTAGRFALGFPSVLIERMPPDDVLGWIEEDKEPRLKIIPQLIGKDFSTDETLAAQFVGKYGDIEKVAGACFSNFTAGSWMGPASSHWEELAGQMDQVANRTNLSKLKRWSTKAARSLREMAERDRKREEEEQLGREW